MKTECFSFYGNKYTPHSMNKLPVNESAMNKLVLDEEASVN